MVWVFGVGGFIGGFVLGIFILKIWLKDKTRNELLHDKSLHLSYGLLVWLIAVLGSVAAIVYYKSNL